MSAPLFGDRNRPPSPDELQPALGGAGGLWAKLDAWVTATYGISGEPFFGGSDGWCVRYRRSGKGLVTLIPRAGSFRALVVIGPRLWTEVAELDLSPATEHAWQSARPYPDGRWLWLDVADEQIAGDVERLVALKSPPPRRARVQVVSSGA
jgi:hypothetical protein